MADMVDGATGAALMKEAADDRLVLTTVRAREAAEALLRVLMLKVPAKNFAPVVNAVVNQRLDSQAVQQMQRGRSAFAADCPTIENAGRLDVLSTSDAAADRRKGASHLSGVPRRRLSGPDGHV